MVLRSDIIEDAFNVGGYLDKQTLDYIAPKWLHDSDAMYNKGFSDKQFELIRNEPSRYLKLPLLRPAALRCAIALQLGVTEDELSEAGIPIGVAQDILWKDDQDIDSACPNFTDHEFAIVSKLSGILAFLHRTDVYLDMEYQYFMDLMRRWLAGHGIELEIVPRKLFP